MRDVDADERPLGGQDAARDLAVFDRALSAIHDEATREEARAVFDRLRASAEILERVRAGVCLSARRLGVWRELTAARDGCDESGRGVAEIYAYRLLPEELGASPLFPELTVAILRRVAASELTTVLRCFCALHPDHRVGVEDPARSRMFRDFDSTREIAPPFAHRTHVEVRRRYHGSRMTESGSRVLRESWWRGALRRLCEGWSP